MSTSVVKVFFPTFFEEMNLTFNIFLILTLVTSLVLSYNARIIGGFKATKHHPFMVSFQVKNEFYSTIYRLEKTYDGWSHFCGASLISTRHAVTAAHCVSEFTKHIQDISILAGTNRLNGNGTRYYIDSIVVHDKYELRKNDIALLKTNDTIVYVPEQIEPVSFSDEFIGDGVLCIAMGWGFTKQNRSQLSDDLLEVKVPTLTNEKCRQAGISIVNETEICTFSKLNEGFCGSDSGGPLVKDNLLVGIIIYNTVKCAIGYPDIYERTSCHYKWLKRNSQVEINDIKD